ncbi:Ger(x)C family spore germination protein [Sporomusa aerivorans]|uniref:Ger(x)C family spore germination protein n=1 Tax=Sporomusa aerivorans TaxID=204936 RepID=UPI003529F04A
MVCRLIASFLLIIVFLLVSGCAGARESDDIAYVLATGIDKSATPGQLDVTYQVAVARALGGGEGGGGGEKQAVVNITITAANLAEARNLLKSAISRIPNLSHNKMFIFGEELAREGLGDIIAPFLRYREFRGSIFVMVVNGGTAKSYIEANKPRLEALPSRYYESMLLTNDETSYYLRSTIHEFYTRLKGGSASPFTVLGGINQGQETVKPDRRLLPGQKVNDFYAGHLPKSPGAQNPVEIMGTALFREDKMVGKLTGQETRMLAILRNEYSKGFIIVADPLVQNKQVNVAARLGESPKIKVRLADGRTYIDIKILLEGEVTSVSSGINYESKEYRPLLEHAVSNLVKLQMERMLTITQELGSDVAGFGYYAKRNFSTFQEWEQFEPRWMSTYQHAEIAIDVETKLRRHGLLFRTSPIARENSDE